MLQRIIACIKRGWAQLRNWLAGRGESVVPTASAKIETPSPPIAAREPEMGLSADVPPVYRQSKSLFTFRERVFFQALLEDVGSQYAVFAKVRLADIIWLANEPENRKHHINQLLCKHFDFLLCEKGTYKPVLVIELDDSSHDKYEHHERDEFKGKVCEDIGLRLWRPRVQQEYPKGSIAGQVRGQIQGSATQRPA
jgi:hypothetical protein